MRKVGFSLAAAATLISGTSLFGFAQSAPIGSANALRATIDGLNIVNEAQHLSDGKRYCWHNDGWNGAGWYRCGYASRNGQGWGGPSGWHGWHHRSADGGRHHRGHKSRHNRDCCP